MVQERDARAVRRYARVADIARRLVQHLADRIFELILQTDGMHDRQRRSVGAPVGLAHVVHPGAGRPSIDILASVPVNNRWPRKRASVSTASSPFDDTDSRCVRGGPKGRASSVPDRISKSRTALPDGAELKTIVSPSGMKRALKIDCGSKVFIVNRSGAVARCSGRPADGDAAASAAIDQARRRASGGTQPTAAVGGTAAIGADDTCGSRQRLERKRDVARRLEALGRILLQTVPDDAIERRREVRARRCRDPAGPP